MAWLLAEWHSIAAALASILAGLRWGPRVWRCFGMIVVANVTLVIRTAERDALKESTGYS